jgi:hypothetical protein
MMTIATNSKDLKNCRIQKNTQASKIQIEEVSKTGQEMLNLLVTCQQKLVDKEMPTSFLIQDASCMSLINYFPKTTREKFWLYIQEIQVHEAVIRIAGCGNLMLQTKREYLDRRFRMELMQALGELLEEWNSTP